MNNIPKPLLKEMLEDPFYKACARVGLHGHICDGRITFEHALIYAGRQIQEKFAIIPLCTRAHAVDNHQDGGDLDKHINEWIALSRATVEEIAKYSRVVNYARKLSNYIAQFGPYIPKVVIAK